MASARISFSYAVPGANATSAEARDEDTRQLLARAAVVAFENNLLVVEETQFDASGAVVYQGKVFFNGSDRVKEERKSGQKRYDLFFHWHDPRHF